MKSKELVLESLHHRPTSRIPVDFGATPVSGIHVKMVEALRIQYGLSTHPVKVIEPYQMLGEIEPDLLEVLGVDVIGLSGKNNMFGFANENWKEFTTNWGQTVLVPGQFMTTTDAGGDTYIYPQGDTSVAPGAKMPSSGYFFDAIIRQEPIDEEKLSVEDNLEEYQPISEEELEHWRRQIALIENTDKAVVANFGGTGLGDIALVPAMNLKHPKGIRDITEWYMSTVMRSDLVHEIFDRQTDIAIHNLEKLFQVVGNKIDIAYICGTDFGTQAGTFCAPEDYDALYLPYYRKINDWIHTHTNWKTFKHSCGAVETFMERFIDSGFDIINPVQINAAGMNPLLLKKNYGDRLTFWGGGVDTQTTLVFGTPQQVRDQVHRQCEILGVNGGFVFNAIHNIQANVPIKNLVAVFEALKEINT